MKTVWPKATWVRIPLPAPKQKAYPCGMLFVFLGTESVASNPPSAKQNRVRIPHPKIEELALQAQGVGIFAEGEYPTPYPCGMLGFFFGTESVASNPLSATQLQNRVRILAAERRPLARRRQGEESSQSESPTLSPCGCPRASAPPSQNPSQTDSPAMYRMY